MKKIFIYLTLFTLIFNVTGCEKIKITDITTEKDDSRNEVSVNVFSIEDSCLEGWDMGYIYKSNDSSVDDKILLIKDGYSSKFAAIGNIGDSIENMCIAMFDKDGTFQFATYKRNTYTLDVINGCEVLLKHNSYGVVTDTINHNFSGATTRGVVEILVKLPGWISHLRNVGSFINEDWGELFRDITSGLIVERLKLSTPVLIADALIWLQSELFKQDAYVRCFPAVEGCHAFSSLNIDVNVKNAFTLSYEYPAYFKLDEIGDYVPVYEKISSYYCGVIISEDIKYLEYTESRNVKPACKKINKYTSALTFSSSDFQKGKTYYIRPYLLTDLDFGKTDIMTEGRILYGNTFIYYANDIITNAEATSCTYLGNELMGISFNGNATIASIEDISAWGVILKDKNGNIIHNYIANEWSNTLDFSNHVTISKSLFGGDNNQASITIAPYYIYGYNATIKYLEESSFDVIWKPIVTTKDATTKSNSATVNCYAEGFDMNSSPNNCSVGVLYSKSNNPTIGNSNQAVSNKKEGGDYSVELKDLDGDQEYYYRAFVRLDNDILYGAIKKFKTNIENLCPDSNHPHAIDLGLPSGRKWSCCNVGASSPEKHGGLYAWGETSEKNVFTAENYAYYSEQMTQPPFYPLPIKDIGSDIAGTSYDVASVKMGGSWRMPSRTMQDELINNCSKEKITINNTPGIIFIGNNNNKIFFPLSDARGGSSFWSSTLGDPVLINYSYYINWLAWYMAVNNSSTSKCYLDDTERWNGLHVRAVCK